MSSLGDCLIMNVSLSALKQKYLLWISSRWFLVVIFSSARSVQTHTLLTCGFGFETQQHERHAQRSSSSLSNYTLCCFVLRESFKNAAKPHCFCGFCFHLFCSPSFTVFLLSYICGRQIPTTELIFALRLRHHSHSHYCCQNVSHYVVYFDVIVALESAGRSEVQKLFYSHVSTWNWNAWVETQQAQSLWGTFTLT